MLKKAAVQPSSPMRAETHPFPELRSLSGSLNRAPLRLGPKLPAASLRKERVLASASAQPNGVLGVGGYGYRPV